MTRESRMVAARLFATATPSTSTSSPSTPTRLKRAARVTPGFHDAVNAAVPAFSILEYSTGERREVVGCEMNGFRNFTLRFHVRPR